MATNTELWLPGSFTKNFSWGDRHSGLRQLYESIRLGFNDKLEDVPREEFRARVSNSGRPDYIPINFFLFNKEIDGENYIVADELVFQAVANAHSPSFDKLALFAFNFSYVGHWQGARPGQRRPALWGYHYIKDRVASRYAWDTRRISADDIERFVRSDPRYRGKTTRKLATNLNYLYLVGRLQEFSEPRVERWWVDAMFLALDRLIEDRKLDRTETREGQYSQLLSRSGFASISGRQSLEKDLATKHLVTLYSACGARGRFSDEFVRNRTQLKLPDVAWLLANDDRPQGAVHPSNPRILKNIPRACAMLARYAGFEVIDADELADFDAEVFVRNHTRQALERLRRNNVVPMLSSDELTKITRDR
jgi:hypothetical protein